MAVLGWVPGLAARRRRWMLIGALTVLLAVAGTASGLARAARGAGNRNGESTSATSLATVTQRSLSSQMQVNGTLGYADSITVVAPTGTTQQALNQAQQQVATAQAALSADQKIAADNATMGQQTIAQDQAAVSTVSNQLASDQAAESRDCSFSASPPRTQACDNDKAAVAKDQATLTQAQNALSTAQLQAQQIADQNNAKLNSDQLAVHYAQMALATAQAATVSPRTTYTALPAVGKTISRGQALYSVAGIPVPLFYGPVASWRALASGMADGPDIGELSANLIALGFGDGLSQSDHFSSATEAAVKRWQASIGAPLTGTVTLGEVVFEPGQIIITNVVPVVGAQVQPGAAILQATSMRRQVVVNLDAALQANVKVGNAVTITLPDNKTTQGVVSSVGSVATTPSGSASGPGASSSGSQPSSPTIEVDISLLDPGATGTLDHAPVQVSITTATVEKVLVVPVVALLAVAGGGDAVEVVAPSAVHRLVPVKVGLFDDADGLVEVSGTGLVAGQRVVVPKV